MTNESSYGSSNEGGDSGYGGSSGSDTNKDEGLRSLTPDILFDGGNLTPVEISAAVRGHLSANSRRVISAQTNQLYYNQNMISLGKLIDEAKQLLRDLQAQNKLGAIYYPVKETSIKGKERVNDLTAMSENLQIFNLDVKLNGHADIISNLEQSVGPLLDTKIIHTIKHLESLKERINETASKVFITGDLNSGKSTFCNALLRRNVLPTDQQPCTNVLCEVLDSSINHGIEQVHAVYTDVKYDINDLGTYEVFKLEDLHHLVYESDKYSMLMVYVDDKRGPNQSLLRNGVVDIALIDAPGLNMDSYQTTQLFSRQEEIDMVVFVVNSENLFTLSGKDFIAAAAREKSFIFIVANKFDTIQDKEKCRRRIMQQVAELSPETHKDANDFVHFVSSSNVLKPGGDGPDDDDDSGPNMDDFDNLEASFRNFVLEKRSISKLQPSKTFLTKICRDLDILARFNLDCTEDLKAKKEKELDHLSPDFDHLISKSAKICDDIDKSIDNLCDKIYSHTTLCLRGVLDDGSQLPNIEYKGISNAVDYALQTRQAMVDRISQTVLACERRAREETAGLVDSIIGQGIKHIGSRPEFQKTFNENAMFSRRRDELGRTVATELEILDFVDIRLPLIPSFGTSFAPSLNKLIHFPSFASLSSSDNKSLTESSTMATTAVGLASVLGGKLLLSNTWLPGTIHALSWINYDTIKKLIVPITVFASLGTVAYIIMDIPRAVPKNLSKKIARQLEEMGYVHSNADRIWKECRKVLRYPANDVRGGFQSLIEKQSLKTQECTKQIEQAENGLRFFSGFLADVLELEGKVDGVHLDHMEVD